MEWINELVNKSKNSKELFAGINEIGRNFQPKRYTRRDMRGNLVDLQDRAEATKEYLEKVHWGKTNTQETPEQTNKREQLENQVTEILENHKGK